MELLEHQRGSGLTPPRQMASHFCCLGGSEGGPGAGQGVRWVSQHTATLISAGCATCISYIGAMRPQPQGAGTRGAAWLQAGASLQQRGADPSAAPQC